MPDTPGMKGKMKSAKGSYIDERVTSHKPVDAPAIFPFDVLEFPSFEVWFAMNECFGVTKQHYFVTNKVCFVTNKVYFVTNKVCFVANKVYFVTNKVCFVTNKHCFAAKQHSFPTKKLFFVAETLTNANR